MGEPAPCLVVSTSACGAGYTRWVGPRFLWHSLLLHVVRVTPDGGTCAFCGTLCVDYTRGVYPRFVWYSLCGLHQMGELALCLVPSISARSAGYTGWVSPRFVWHLFVWNCLCGLHQMGELALCVVLFTSACSVGHTRWVSQHFVWYPLLLHVVRVTPDG